MKATTMLGACAVLGLCACSDNATPPDAGDDVLDVRVAIPPEEAGTVDLVAPEFTVDPGQDVMMCQHGIWEGPSLGVRDVEMLQGKFGHHAVILRSVDPKPAGTIEDCTDQSQMANFQAFLIPTNGLPDGYGILLEEGQPWVLQSHYVNADEKPLLVRDVVRLRTFPAEEIETYVSTFTTVTLEYTLPYMQPHTIGFDCAVEEDLQALYIGGHMHEQGSAFEMFIGTSAETMESVYRVDEWKPEYRDAPPVLNAKDDPFVIPAGSIIRTTCSYYNTIEEGLGFPDEMCVGFGMIAGRKDLFDCRDEDHLDSWVE